MFIEVWEKYVPYCSCQQRVKGIQPVVHVFLIVGLQEDPPMFCAHSKRVGSLKETMNYSPFFMEEEVGSLCSHQIQSQEFK